MKEKVFTKKFLPHLLLTIGTIVLLTMSQFGAKSVEAFEIVEYFEDEAVTQVDQETLIYEVSAGDTLWKIAEEYGVDVEMVAAINGLDPEEELAVDKILTLPNEQLIVHRVNSGETLWGIARSYGIDKEVLAEENRIEDVTMLKEGQDLFIPQRVFITTTTENDDLVRRDTVRASTSRGGVNLSFIWPTEGRISSLFGMRDGSLHRGLDIANMMGEPIKAALSGKVIFAGPRGNYGNAIIIDHGRGYTTLYAHASKILVAPGDNVRKGEEIAKIGSTGRSTGPHLHFEVREDEEHKDPIDYLPNRY